MKKSSIILLFSGAFFITLEGAAQSNLSNAYIPPRVITGQGDDRGNLPGFYAYADNNMVALRWQGSNEGNIDRYVVERSFDGIHFDPLHEVVARGDAKEPADYKDADSYPLARLNYYRIKTITRDGNAFYSPIVRIDMTGKYIPSLKPTVVQTGGTIRLDTWTQVPLSVIFFNASGARTASFIVNTSSFNINVSGWGKGLYFYRISDATHPLIDAGKIMVL